MLAHCMPDGSGSPLGFVSRTLSPAEKKYSQLDKEALAIIFGIKIHKYLYGHTFTVCTDHRPLVALFVEKKAIPQMGSTRVQMWVVLLSTYEYQIVYRPGKFHSNADGLSRLPLPESPGEEKETEQVLIMDCIDSVPVDSMQIKSWTAKDSVLSQITIEKLCQSFSVLGLPQVLVSDNRNCFTSTEFEKFMKQNGIRHVKTAPFHHSTNKLAERAVQTLKESLKKAKGDTIEANLSRFLFSYRNSTCNDRGVTSRTDDVPKVEVHL
ncbi:hypothetical protein SRHO_G00123140 [Serrasalmus rhombeus]